MRRYISTWKTLYREKKLEQQVIVIVSWSFRPRASRQPNWVTSHLRTRGTFTVTLHQFEMQVIGMRVTIIFYFIHSSWKVSKVVIRPHTLKGKASSQFCTQERKGHFFLFFFVYVHPSMTVISGRNSAYNTTPCIRVPKFSAGASRYSEAQPEQAEAKRRTR